MQKIVLYGNSLVVSSFGANLAGYPELQLVQVDTNKPGADQMLEIIRPDIVIFDLTTEHTDFAVSLWKALPDLLLIGVNPESSELLLLSGRKHEVLCVDELLSIIQGKTYR